MEILFVSHKYPPATGGMEKQSYELINGMKSITQVYHIVFDGQESRFNFFISLGKRIRQLVKLHPGISVIHFNDGLLGAFSMLHYGYRHLKRTVTLHGLDVVFPGFLYQRLIVPRFTRFDLIFAVSRATADACRFRGIADEKIVVVNNGVAIHSSSKPCRSEVLKLLFDKYFADVQSKKLLVTIGRPVKRKGFSWFIKNVMPHLHEDFILILIGPLETKESFFGRIIRSMPAGFRSRIELFLGTSSDEYVLNRLLIDEDATKKRVIHLGKLPTSEIDAILSVADAFIMPNIEVEGDMEGFGLVCLEAALRGLTVFASASGGITDAISHGSNGFLLPPGHVASWVQQLNLIVEDEAAVILDPQEVIDYSAKRFSWKKMCDDYYAHFSRL